MSESKHTPGPLVHVVTGPNHWLQSPDGRTVAFVGAQDTIFTKHPGTPHVANAERLVMCWNLHDELVEALQRSERQYQALARHFGDKWPADASGTNKARRAVLDKATRKEG